MSLFAAGAAAGQAAVTHFATEQSDRALVHVSSDVGAFVPPPMPASFLSFSSAPDLSPPPAAAAAVAKSSRGAIDLTRSPSRKERKLEKDNKKESKKESKKEEKKHRKRSRKEDASRSRSRERPSKKLRDENRESKKREKKAAKQSKSSVTLRRSRTPSPSDSDAPMPQRRQVDRMEIDESSDASADEAELARSLREKSAAVLRAEEAADRAKIIAIEMRLADPRTRPSYLAQSLPSREVTYLLDAKGDLNNLLYQSIYRMDIPVYPLAGGLRFMLGAELWGLLPVDLPALLKRRGPGEPVRLPPRRERTAKRDRYYANRWHADERNRHLKRLRLAQASSTSSLITTDEFAAGVDFVSLSLPVEAASASVAASSATTVEIEGASFHDASSMLTRDFNVALRLRPQCVPLWLDFVHAQEMLLNPMRRVCTGAALWEKQALILQKALEANPGDLSLTLALVGVARWLWDSPQVERLFLDACEAHPTSLQLWLAFIEWKCGDGRDSGHQFQIDEVATVYARGIAAFQHRRRHLCAQHAQTQMANATTMQQRAVELQLQLREINRSLAHLFTHYTRLLRHSGYTERALALWQAQLEWNCFRPRQGPFADPALAREYFEHFWESDVPRVGEEGTRGFSAWCHSVEMGRPTSAEDESNEAGAGSSQPPHAGPLLVSDWLRLEQQLDASQWQPRRSIPFSLPTESASSSLYRVVLFDELRDFIFDLAGVEGEHDRTPDFDAQAALLTHEFALSGLLQNFDLPPQLFMPPGGVFLNSTQALQNGSPEIRCTSAATAASPTHSLSTEFFERVPFIGDHEISDPFLGSLASPARVVHEDLSTPMTGDYAQIDLAQLRDSSSSPDAALRALLASPSKVAFIRRSLQDLLAVFPESNVIKTCTVTFEYGLSSVAHRLESSISYPFSTARTLVKSMLKADPLNLLLLNSYAMLEFVHGFEDTARGIYERTLSVAHQLPEQLQQDSVPILFWSYAHLQLVRAYRSERDTTDDSGATLVRHALHILLCASEGTLVPFDPAQPNLRPMRLLKARKTLAAAVSGPSPTARWAVPYAASLSGLSISPAAALATLWMWLEYLTQGVEAATRVWTDLNTEARASALRTTTFAIGDMQHEWLTTMHLRLLTAHRSRNSYAPRLFREAIKSALESFPSNSSFLSLLTESYRGSASSGALRKYFDEALSGDSRPVLTHESSAAASSKPSTEENPGAQELIRNAGLNKRPMTGPSSVVLLHAIQAELTRQGAGHRVRTLLEKSLQSSSHLHSVTSHSLMLWRLALRYEVCKGQVGAASKLLYRATHAVPFSKTLCLNAIGWIHQLQEATVSSTITPTAADPAALTESQIQQFYRSLQDRSVRTRANLLPERGEDEDTVAERPWDRYVRLEHERNREQRRQSRRHRSRRRSRHHRSRSRSRSRTRSNSSDRAPSISRSRSCSPRRRRSRRHRSRSSSRSSSESRSRSRSRSVSSSLERHRQRYREPLPRRPDTSSEEEGVAHEPTASAATSSPPRDRQRDEVMEKTLRCLKQ